ncbi:hypothetical protein L1787_07740 [Acuticoccus sp. M5D2P5]|uniref:hypothetical protein n=1 Tax=Acuticoccus kalidii TaxID=2910977 RepID=UPI001F172A48|nr:hypothetical protein [Acuticoccus kalidii]MCF3933302.1 hypothetical protein [Acuticoccus kalidii]
MYRAGARLGLKPFDVDAMSLAQWLAFIAGHSDETAETGASWSAGEFKELLKRHGH